MAKTPINTDYVVKESHTICSIHRLCCERITHHMQHRCCYGCDEFIRSRNHSYSYLDSAIHTPDHSVGSV
jgi:hypothetical protein